MRTVKSSFIISVELNDEKYIDQTIFAQFTFEISGDKSQNSLFELVKAL